MSAELAARITAARAVVGDFRRDCQTAPLTSPPPMGTWALRLASVLSDLLAILDASPAPEPGSGKLAAIRGVLDAFDRERDDLLYVLEKIEQIAGASRTASGIDPGGSATITPVDLPTVLGALADAVDLLEHRAAQWCDGCNASPADLCDEHTADLDQAGAYRALAARLREDQ